MSTYVTAIDFGSAKIAVAVGELRDGKVHVVHYEAAPSEGIRSGEVFNDYKVSKILTPMIRRAEEAIGETISSAVVSVSGRAIGSRRSTGRDSRRDNNRQISSEDVKRMIAEQYAKGTDGGNVVLEVAPQSYDTDDQMGLAGSDLDGIRSGSLEGNFKVFIGKDSLIAKRKQVLDGVGMKMRKSVFSPIASARAVLTPQEMDNGVALVDIGKDLTEIVIIKENIVRDAFTIPFAGESITTDIKNVTNFTATWAETVKLSIGSCLEEKVPDNKSVELVGEEGETEGTVDLLKLTRIIEARMSEILDAIKYLIANSGYGDRIPAGVVITGGTAYLEDLPYLATAILGRKVRIAAPRSSIASDSAEGALDAFASTAVGLLLEFYSPRLTTTTNAPQGAEIPLGGKRAKGGFFSSGAYGDTVQTKVHVTAGLDTAALADLPLEGEDLPVGETAPAPKPEPEPKPEPAPKPKKPMNLRKGIDSFFGTLFNDDGNGNNV